MAVRKIIPTAEEPVGADPRALAEERTAVEGILVDTVAILRGTRRTGVISVNAGTAKGLIYIESGVLRHAILGRRRGEAAIVAMLRLPESRVHFKEGSYPNLPVNVKLPWEELVASLLDGARGPSAP